MSQSVRDLPIKKPINLVQVFRGGRRHQTWPLLPELLRGRHKSREGRQEVEEPKRLVASPAVKLVAKMAILIHLANQCGSLNASLVHPSSQTQHKMPSTNHLKPTTQATLKRQQETVSSRVVSLTNDINTFEWPRLKNQSTSSRASDKQARNSTEIDRRTSTNGPYEIERLPQHPSTRYDDGPPANGSRHVNIKSRQDLTTSNKLLNLKQDQAIEDRLDADDEFKQTAIVQLNSRHADPSLHHSLKPDDLHTNSSIALTITSNKNARSIHHHDDQSLSFFNRMHQPPGQLNFMQPAAHNQLGVDVAESSRVEHNPECALILKRTYILKHAASNNPDEWGEKFVFNDVDPDDDQQSESKRRHKVHKTDLCIKHSDVNRALEEAKHRIKFEKPGDLGSFEVGERSLASIGELNLATGLLLTKRFDLSPDEIMNALPMIDMSASKGYWNDLCPKHAQPMVCMKSRYRTITAHCNNLKHPSWGASKTPYSRYLPPDYADGLSAPRAAHNGQPLPSARLITSVVHQDSDEPSHDYSVLFADWGQLLNHDITRVAVGEAPDCCPQLLKGLCMPIPVPPNDPLYSKHNVKCLKFERSLAATRPKCLLGHRAQINLITSPVDASFVYGSTKAQAQKLRAHTGGKMKVLNFFDKHKLKPLLPPKMEEPDKDCVARPKHLFCFEAGDVRVNEQTHLTVLHTVYLREHNRIAKQLGAINMEWDDDKIYHETRHIVAACVQHVMVNEFLPLLLGAHHVNEYKLKPTPEGYWQGYDPSVTISTGTAFAAAAFRYGHSMIEGTIRRLDAKSGMHVKSELLRHLFKRPFWLYEPGAVDQLIAGMLLTPAEQTDPWVSEELSGHLFQPPKAQFGHDLAAINIQRGRDQGVPGYNDWREWCGLKRARSFDDLEPLLMHHTAMQYAKLYKHVDDIDLWSAGISERKLPNSAVGPTMACIIARQFLNYKRGDRFWYENGGQPSSFTPGQLREIKKITLAKVLCSNADDLPRIQPWAMRLPHPIYNAKVPCESLPTINLKLWDSNLMDSSD